jgi:hypothetical protein
MSTFGFLISLLMNIPRHLRSHVLLVGLQCSAFRMSVIRALKCDGTCAETRFRLSAQRTSPCKSAGPSVQLINGSRGVRIGGSNAAYTMFRGSVKSTGYTLLSPVSPSLPLPCVSVCHHISTGLYLLFSVQETLTLKMKKVKVKVTHVQALRLCTGCTAHGRSRGIVLPFHDHGTRRG